jgi:hypothetical protein
MAALGFLFSMFVFYKQPVYTFNFKTIAHLTLRVFLGLNVPIYYFFSEIGYIKSRLNDRLLLTAFSGISE